MHKTQNKDWKLARFAVICFLSISLFAVPLSLSLFSERNSPELSTGANLSYIPKFNPRPSDISGNELYAEQINFNIGGKYNLIQQSYCTNDTNALEGIDLSDPAFSEAAFILSFSNGIDPSIVPFPIGRTNRNYISTSTESLRLLLYFKGNNDFSTISTQKTRILDILKHQLNVDFLLLNQSENTESGYLYEYFGLNPVWMDYIAMSLSNIPQDGYWDTVDYQRILSDSYLTSQYLQSSLFYLKRFDYLQNGINKILENPLRNPFDLSPLESSTSIFNIADFQSENLGNSDNGATSAEENSYINRTSNLIFFTLQYEGIPNEKIISEHQSYSFDLFHALNYNGSRIGISSKCYNSLDGISLSKIDIGLIFGEAYEIEPEILSFNNNSFSQIENLLFLVDDSMDFSFFDDYQFKIKWRTQDSLSMLSTIPVNYQNSSDIINFLELLADFPILSGLLNDSVSLDSQLGSGISGSIVAPLEHFHFDYRISEQEPSLKVRKKIQDGQTNNILNPDNTPEINITVSNDNNFSVWGQEVNLTVLGISNDPTQPLTVLGLDQNIFELLGYDTNFIINVLETLGYTLEDLFHNENPRFFMLDVNNSGEYDALFPNLLDLNLNRFIPYSPEFTQILIDNSEAFGNVAVNPQIWNSTASIFNPENWKLDPGESFSLTQSNGLAGMDEKYNKIQGFTPSSQAPHNPVIAIGKELTGTRLEYSFNKSDGNYWELESESYGNSQQIQMYLFFDNTTELLHLLNQSIDLNAIFLDSYLQSSAPDTNYQLEIYNHQTPDITADGFEEIASGTINSQLISVNFTLSDIDYNLSDYLESEGDIGILVRLSFQNEDAFHLLFDYLQVEFQDRLNQYVFFNQTIVQYCSRLSKNQYFSRSNTLVISTSESATIEVIPEITMLDPINSLYLYNISISNSGSLPAFNISAQISQLGILSDLSNYTYLEINNQSIFTSHAGNFTIVNGVLSYNFEKLNAGETISNLTFRFDLTHSIMAPSLNISWENGVLYHESQDRLLFLTYQDYLSKPLLYNVSLVDLPLHLISLNYFLKEELATYDIGSNVSIIVEIENLKASSVFGVKIDFICPHRGWSLVNTTKTLNFSEIAPYEIIEIELEYQKNSVYGYLIPPHFKLTSEESSYLQIKSNKTPILIGNFGFSISKQISKDVLTMGNVIEVTLTVSNIGNVPLGSISVYDADSFSTDAFELEEGIMIFDIDYLGINQSTQFNYTLKSLNNDGIYSIEPARSIYYFGYSYKIRSNSFVVKIREPYFLTSLRIFGPITIGSLSLFLVYRYKIRYSREDFEYQRRENLLFGKSLRESSWHRKNLTEFFKEQNVEGGGLHE